MNVLYDYQIFGRQKFGGISRYFFELVRRVAPKEAVYLFQGFNVNEYGLSREAGFVDVFSRHVPSIPKSHRAFEMINNLCLRNFLNRRNIDILHPTYYDDTSVLLNSDKTKLVVTVYDMIHELYPKMFKGDKTADKKRLLLNKADGIIAISEKTKADIVEILGINPNKIKVIYLANSLNYSVGEKIINESYILYVGNRNGYKNFNSFIESYAISEIKSDVLCICFGGGSFSEAEKALMRKLGVANRVKQIGGDDLVLANLYAYALSFVYPSLYEGFGLPPLEAMHYGTPVLAGNVSCIPEVVGNAGLYFDPNSIADMAEKIYLITKNKDVRKNLKKRGYEREKFFSWEKCADETIDFYHKVVEGVY